MKISKTIEEEVDVRFPLYKKNGKHTKKFVEILEKSHTEICLFEVPDISSFDSHAGINAYFDSDWQDSTKEEFEQARQEAMEKWQEYINKHKTNGEARQPEISFDYAKGLIESFVDKEEYIKLSSNNTTDSEARASNLWDKCKQIVDNNK